jgi:hypothetical protein
MRSAEKALPRTKRGAGKKGRNMKEKIDEGKGRFGETLE